MDHRTRTTLTAAGTALVLAVSGATAAQAVTQPPGGRATALNAAPPPGLAPPVGPSLNTSFVTRDGASLVLDGEPFRFSGPNIYWLGLDENVGGVDYPTRFRIRDALDTAAATGATVVRSHMLASTGAPLTLRPEAGVWNDEAFATIDYAMAYAGELGLRLVLPLTDEWEYYHGGHRDFTDPLGLPSEAFYSDPRAVAAFDEYVTRVLTHENPYTGLSYAEDPTVLAFELGNELQGMTPQWIEGRTALLRELAPEHLVAGGTRFGLDPDTLTSSLDIVDVHYYPPTAEAVLRDAAQVAAADKVYLGGEYASTAISEELLGPLVDEETVGGLLYWSLFPHHDRGGFVPHDDGFTLHVPGDTPQMRHQVDVLEDFSRALLHGRAADAHELDQPLITEISRRAGVPQVTWRGTADAAGYHLERAAGPRSRWVRLTDEPVPTTTQPWLDLSEQLLGAASLYRVVPVGRDGTEGPSSDPVRVDGEGAALVDPLEDWSLTSSRSEQLTTVPAGDESAVVVDNPDGSQQITWDAPRTTGLELLVAARGRPTGPSGTLRVEVPGATGSWTPVDVRVTRESRDRWRVAADDLPEVDRVRVVWAAPVGRGTAKVVSVVRATVHTQLEPVTAAPGAFDLLEPADGADAVGTSPTLRWEDAPDAAYYRLSIRPEDDDRDLITATGLRAATWTPPTGLAPGTTYEWSVTAVNGAGSTDASTSGTFTTRSLPTEPVVVEDFSGLADDAAARAAVTVNPGGDPITVSLARGDRRDPAAEDDTALALTVQPGGAGYAGISRNLPAPQDWWGQRGLQMWVDPEDTSPITVQIIAGGNYWEAVVTPQTTEGQLLQVPFTAFAPPSWASGASTLDLTSVTQLSVYLAGTATPRTTVVDSVATYL